MPRNNKSKKPIKPMKLDISDEMIAERRGGSGPMPKNMPKWMASSITKIDLFSKWVGNVVCWITIPLILAMTYEVLARKLFTAPTMWAYDMSRFMYGALFMLGAGYALSKGVHIRADFLYRNFKTKTQGRIDVIRIYRPSSSWFYSNWCNVVFYICWFSNIVYINFSRICIWLLRFWKISILFNDLTVFNGHDRTNVGRRPTLCLYGNYDGASWINGKIIFGISINVG